MKGREKGNVSRGQGRRRGWKGMGGALLLAYYLEVRVSSGSAEWSVMGMQDKMACHLHPILCSWDAVITCTPVTVFFQLGVQLCSQEKMKQLIQL